jgi:shikimate dehydrogenase
VWQQASRNLQVEDGWVYFLHGWTQVVAQVLHMELDKKRFDELKTAAVSLWVFGSNRERKG